MVMYMCPICGDSVSGGENHKCKLKPIPFNVFSDNTEKEDEKLEWNWSQKSSVKEK